MLYKAVGRSNILILILLEGKEKEKTGPFLLFWRTTDINVTMKLGDPSS